MVLKLTAHAISWGTSQTADALGFTPETDFPDLGNAGFTSFLWGASAQLNMRTIASHFQFAFVRMSEMQQFGVWRTQVRNMFCGKVFVIQLKVQRLQIGANVYFRNTRSSCKLM